MLGRKEPEFNKTIKIGKGYYDIFNRNGETGYVYFIHVPTKTFFARFSSEMFSYTRLFWKLFNNPEQSNSLPRALKEKVENTCVGDWAVRLSIVTDISGVFEKAGYVQIYSGRLKNRMTTRGEQPYPKKFFGVTDKVTKITKHFWLPENYTRKQVMTCWHNTFKLMTKLSTQRNCSIELKTKLMNKSLSTVEAAAVWPKSSPGRFKFFDCSSDYEGIESKDISKAVKANNLKFLKNLVS